MSACAALTHLDLSHCQHVTGLAPLRPLRSLASLVLVDASRALHPPCMAQLAELPALRAVEVSGKRLDDGCMQVGGGEGMRQRARGRCLLWSGLSVASGSMHGEDSSERTWRGWVGPNLNPSSGPCRHVPQCCRR